jgi:hypothetical protein
MGLRGGIFSRQGSDVKGVMLTMRYHRSKPGQSKSSSSAASSSSTSSSKHKLRSKEKSHSKPSPTPSSDDNNNKNPTTHADAHLFQRHIETQPQDHSYSINQYTWGSTTANPAYEYFSFEASEQAHEAQMAATLKAFDATLEGTPTGTADTNSALENFDATISYHQDDAMTPHHQD